MNLILRTKSILFARYQFSKNLTAFLEGFNCSAPYWSHWAFGCYQYSVINISVLVTFYGKVLIVSPLTIYNELETMQTIVQCVFCFPQKVMIPHIDWLPVGKICCELYVSCVSFPDKYDDLCVVVHLAWCRPYNLLRLQSS